MMRTWIVVLVWCAVISPCFGETDLANHLQEISVTVRAGGSEGSGVIVTRELKVKTGAEDVRAVNFVWTAAHVVRSLRSVRTVIDAKGQERKTVEFRPAEIIKELVEDGRKVGELKMEASVIRYSDADNGEDLALLQVRKKNFVSATATFYSVEEPIAIGTNLFHVGSLLGQSGANSMTSGIVSQIGRVLELGNSTGRVFDQTTVVAFPGSSGGGVYLATGDNAGQCVGLLVRGAGEGFNLIVPVRRMHQWCKEGDLEWAIDPTKSCPSLDELSKRPIENEAAEANLPTEAVAKGFPFLILIRE